MEIMLDLETLGTAPGAAILSIGAAAFDLHKGYQHNQFEIFVQVQPQLDAGMAVSAGTVSWWLNQSDAARYKITSAKAVHPVDALRLFNSWLSTARFDNEGVWGHGLNFDVPILEALYRKFSITPPWGYRDGRDTRTIFHLAGKKMGDFGTVNDLAHSAVADAIYQADETAKCVNYLRAQRVAASRMMEPVPATSGDI